jgi:hypothetical protein
MIGQAIRDSQVVSTKEITDWDWDLIPAILKVRNLIPAILKVRNQFSYPKGKGPLPHSCHSKGKGTSFQPF